MALPVKGVGGHFVEIDEEFGAVSQLWAHAFLRHRLVLQEPLKDLGVRDHGVAGHGRHRGELLSIRETAEQTHGIGQLLVLHLSAEEVRVGWLVAHGGCQSAEDCTQQLQWPARLWLDPCAWTQQALHGHQQ